MTPGWWHPMAAELERLRLMALQHGRSGDPLRWSSVQALASHHEEMCLALLRHHGWVADRWGQALISAPLRDALRATQSPLRWSPDVLAVRGCEWALIDCKAETRIDTDNFSVEKAALDALFAIDMASTDAQGECAFIWHDFSWSPVAHVHMTEKVDGPHLGNGSATPYWLVPKTVGLDFRDRFGRRAEVSA